MENANLKMKQFVEDVIGQPEKPDENKLKDTPSVTRELSFGEKLVGITFNPSNDGDVSEIKTKMAELINLLWDRNKQNESSELSKLVYDAAIVSLLEAQMMAVKYVTLKY